MACRKRHNHGPPRSGVINIAAWTGALLRAGGAVAEEPRNCPTAVGADTEEHRPRPVGAVAEWWRMCGPLPRAVGALTDEARLLIAAGAVIEVPSTSAAVPRAVGALMEEGRLPSAVGAVADEARLPKAVKAAADDDRICDPPPRAVGADREEV